MSYEPTTTHLYAGIVVRDREANSRLGTIGAIAARARDGMLYGLTAAHVIASEALSTDGTTLGAHDPSFPLVTTATVSGLPISCAISFVRISDEIYVAGSALPVSASGQLVDPISVIGQTVRKCSRGTHSSIARVTGIHCPLNIRSDGSQNVISYFDAIELSGQDEAVPLASAGDSGAAIMSERGEFVGIILAGLGSRFFVAPATVILEENGFALADVNMISAHNAAVMRKRNETSIDEFERERSCAQWSVVQEFATLVVLPKRAER
jgi:hypothetical protein